MYSSFFCLLFASEFLINAQNPNICEHENICLLLYCKNTLCLKLTAKLFQEKPFHVAQFCHCLSIKLQFSENCRKKSRDTMLQLQLPDFPSFLFKNRMQSCEDCLFTSSNTSSDTFVLLITMWHLQQGKQQLTME